jgi:hypothetical protein
MLLLSVKVKYQLECYNLVSHKRSLVLGCRDTTPSDPFVVQYVVETFTIAIT